MIDGKRVSITTGCLGRVDYLTRALDSWLAAPEPDEIVIVDWGNQTPLRESLSRIYDPRVGSKTLCDPRVVIARVDGQRGWKHSKCHNLEMLLSTGDLILRIDIDCLIKDGFFAAHPVREGMFYAGNWRLAPGTNEASLNGTAYLHRSDMLGINGYNERLLHYGYEDDDFYERLMLAGLKRADLSSGTIRHMPHSDRSRYENQEIAQNPPATEKDERDYLLRLIDKNHVAVSRQRRWSPEDPATSWKMDWSDDRRYVECVEVAASRSGGIRDVVFRQDADDPASREDEQLGAKTSPESRIYASCDKYDERFVTHIFRAMKILHDRSARASTAKDRAHLGEDPRLKSHGSEGLRSEGHESKVGS